MSMFNSMFTTSSVTGKIARNMRSFSSALHLQPSSVMPISFIGVLRLFTVTDIWCFHTWTIPAIIVTVQESLTTYLSSAYFFPVSLFSNKPNTQISIYFF